MISSSSMTPTNHSPENGTFVGSPGGAWPGYKKKKKKWKDLFKLLQKRSSDWGGVGRYTVGQEVL